MFAAHDTAACNTAHHAKASWRSAPLRKAVRSRSLQGWVSQLYSKITTSIQFSLSVMSELANGSGSGKRWVKYKPWHHQRPYNEQGTRETADISALALLTVVEEHKLVLAVSGQCGAFSSKVPLSVQPQISHELRSLQGYLRVWVKPASYEQLKTQIVFTSTVVLHAHTALLEMFSEVRENKDMALSINSPGL